MGKWNFYKESVYLCVSVCAQSSVKGERFLLVLFFVLIALPHLKAFPNKLQYQLVASYCLFMAASKGQKNPKSEDVNCFVDKTSIYLFIFWLSILYSILIAHFITLLFIVLWIYICVSK